MLKYAIVHAEVDVLRELVQLRRPFEIEATHPLSSLMIPSTLEEWHAARRAIQKGLLDLGCDDAEAATILGVERRRVAERRRRMSVSKTAE